jgi:hypothetical protein
MALVVDMEPVDMIVIDDPIQNPPAAHRKVHEEDNMGPIDMLGAVSFQEMTIYPGTRTADAWWFDEISEDATDTAGLALLTCSCGGRVVARHKINMSQPIFCTNCLGVFYDCCFSEEHLKRLKMYRESRKV